MKAGVAFFIFFSLFFPSNVFSEENPNRSREVDNRLYSEILKRYVYKGVVDYSRLKQEEEKLDQYLKILEEINSKVLARNEQLSFYINAYNAWTIKLVLSEYPGIKSIKEIGGVFGSPWKKKICRIDGKIISLDNIEHDIIRPRFKDPRIHFAVNCASKGCPPLRSEPYVGAELNKQLDEVTQDFINDTERNRLEGEILWASKIFSWYEEDFNNDIKRYFLEYAQGDFKKQLELKKNDIKIRYLDYDWNLNSK